MNNQKILDNSPDDDGKWTHHTSDNVYLMDRDGRFYFWCAFMEGWESFKGMRVFGVRSRVDIERIAGLKKEVGYLRHRLSPFEAAEKLDNLLKIS